MRRGFSRAIGGLEKTARERENSTGNEAIERLEMEQREKRRTTSKLTYRDMLDHFMARWAVNRSGHLVEPGLYELGEPGPESPVFVTANYTMSFDALRSALEGLDAHILVLDTKGVNVWCAAGKGAFGTDELVRRIESEELGQVVSGREVTLPQLGASGVAAHEVREKTGFKVRYGPVRAEDIPEYLRLGEATREMRLVKFDLKDRVVLIPVELVGAFLPAAAGSLAMMLLDGPLGAAGMAGAALAGLVAFPVALPYLPAREFSAKGYMLGAAAAVPFAICALLAGEGKMPERIARAASYLLAFPSLTAFLALNFTGSTPIASKSGVEDEIAKWIPIMAWTGGSGAILALGLGALRLKRSETAWLRRK